MKYTYIIFGICCFSLKHAALRSPRGATSLSMKNCSLCVTQQSLTYLNKKKQLKDLVFRIATEDKTKDIFI
jgi:hypothetical protein